MKRPLFLCLLGLVLGEAMAITWGWKGIFFVVLILLSGGIFCIQWRNNQSHFFICIFLPTLMGSLFGMSVLQEKETLSKEILSLQGYLYGTITYQKINQEGNYEIILKNGFFYENKEDFYEKRNSRLQLKQGCRVLGLEKTKVSLLPGDEILCKGKLGEIPENTNPGEFNGNLYYCSRGIVCQFFAEDCLEQKLGGFSFSKLAYYTKRKILTVYEAVLQEEHAALLNAMVLGDKSLLSREQKQRYEKNGVAHLLAVSGLHVSIVAGSWFRLLRKKKMSYGISCLSGLFLLLFYGCMTGFGNSVIRAAVMYAVFLGAEFLGADYDMTSAMSLAGIGMLMESPWRLLEGGCQLSFGAIFAIGFVLPWIKELTEKRKGEEEGRVVSFSALRKWCREGMMGSLVISGITFPILLRVFYECSPYSIFWNLLLIPCMAPLMGSAILGGLAGICCLPVAKLVCLPAKIILSCFDWLLNFAGELPGAVWVTGCPSFFEIVLIYILEGFILLLWYYRLWKYYVPIGILCWSIFFWMPSKELLSMTMLDVGQGESLLIQTPNQETILVDGGSVSKSKVGEYVIEPALKYKGVEHLDYVIVSHGDEDHISGILELLELGYPIRNLLLPKGNVRQEALQHLVKLAEKSNTRVVYFEKENQIRFPDMRITCLHPAKGFPCKDSNEGSLVLHLQYRSFDVLLTGDIEAEGEESLCQQKLQEKMQGELEVLKVAHHGSKYSTGEKFLTQTRPQMAWISAGKNNFYGHPHKEVLDRLKKRQVLVYQTKEKGALWLQTDGIKWKAGYFKKDKNKRGYFGT